MRQLDNTREQLRLGNTLCCVNKTGGPGPRSLRQGQLSWIMAMPLAKRTHLDSDDQCSGISSLEDIDEGVWYTMEPVPHIITIA